ncbi:hypothetical protein KUTeg_006665 [Tegillarca granosa]|uniref:Uncharacterized protein n=1 Tax=Tegillarca granosa TaxID=220873 RepID=A0ABQ9FE08_TEGGR|nr:hypothetical protein KUTeg_006665 [Tegillarca granosa]
MALKKCATSTLAGKMVNQLILGILCALVAPHHVQGAPDNRGTEFIIGFMDNYEPPSVVYDLELFVTTSRTTTVNVRVRCPNYGTYDKSFTVTAGYVQN